MRRDFSPRSVEGFQLVHGRTPTQAELDSALALAPVDAGPISTASNGCDCYDEECSTCSGLNA